MVQDQKPKRHPWRSDQEWLEIIQTCRTSGMSDKTWCEEHHICPSKLYYHIRRLRAKSYDIPELQPKAVHHPKQEIVAFSSDGTCLQGTDPHQDQPCQPDLKNTASVLADPAIRLTFGNCCVDIFNHAAGDTILNTLTVLRKLC